MRRKRNNSGVVRLSLCGRAAGRGWGWDNEEKEKGMSMSVSVSACSILLRATRIQRCKDWFTFYQLSTLNWYKAHTPRRYSGERLGNNKRELDILCLVISQRIDGVHAIFLLLIYIIARRPELYSTARVTTNDPVNDIRM